MHYADRMCCVPHSPWRLAVAVCLLLAGCGGRPDGDPPARAAGEVGGGSAARAAEPARDLVLITLDTLRHDALPFSGGPWATPAPHLEKLAARGRRFRFALAHNTVTLPSHTNLLTGLYPYQHGVRENTGFVLDAEIPTAATLLSEAGFATGAFVSALTLDSRYGLDRGFDVYDDQLQDSERTGLFQVGERRGDVSVQKALRWWQNERSRRRFLWLHLFDPHAPYAPPRPWAERFPDQPYRGEVAAVDAFLAELLDHLDGSRDGRPLVVVTADHGEALGDHGEQTHGVFAYQSTLQVPLIVWGPGIVAGVDDRLARHVDVLPTLLDAAAVDPPDGLAGASLLRDAALPASSYFECLGPTLERGWAPLRGVVAGRHKLIDLPLPELYDLDADPAEERNLVDDERRRFHELRGLLPSESAWPPARGVVSAEEVARLRSLGYLADTAAPKASYGPQDDPKRLIHLDETIHLFAADFAAGRFEQAEAHARELVAERPSMPVGHTQLAHALLGQGRLQDAVSAMQSARLMKAASPGLVRQLGLSLAETGRPAEALPLLEPLAGSGDPDAESVYGQVLQELGRTSRAEAVLQGVVEREPEHAASWERLSAVALDGGRADLAEQHARRALSLDSGRARSWNNLGVALLMSRRPDEAFEAWRQALELDPRSWDTLYNLGMQAARFGRREIARDALRRFVDQAPGERYAADLPKARSVLSKLSEP